MNISEKLLSIEKSDIYEASKELDKTDLPVLVELLCEKDDKVRYQALLLLQSRTEYSDDVYPFWDKFASMLRSDNSYHRSIGVMMISSNAKWDKDDKFDIIIEDYFKCLHDEKPITVRQCIQSLQNIIPYKPKLKTRIEQAVMDIDIMQVKETMRKSILQDIIGVLLLTRKYNKTDATAQYILDAIDGDILDKKAIKNIEAML